MTINGPGGAWYPGPIEQWTNNSRVVSNGNYVMMVVHENCDDIVSAFTPYSSDKRPGGERETAPFPQICPAR